MKEVCRQNLKKAYLFLDGEVLTEAERTDIRLHLEACKPCLERYGLEEELVALISRLRNACQCPTQLKSRINTLLEQA